jgi:hypothetical protein
MPKDAILRARVSQDLAERVAADQKEAGEARIALTIRRLIERGLGNPYLRQAEQDSLKELVYQLGQIGNNLNQLARRLNVHGDLQDFQLEDLKAATASLGVTDRKIRELLSKSR